MRIALLHSRIRVEERMLIDELTTRRIDHEVIDVRACTWSIHALDALRRFDVVVERCISQTQALAAVRLFEAAGVPCVNASEVIDICGDKLRTSLALARAGVPTPRVHVALDEPSALQAIEDMGYPCVLKPVTGSWGRLLARVNDRDAAEAIVEHKGTLGSVQHGVFYVQEFVDKPGRDIRAFVSGDEVLCAISRASSHWITNTARGGVAAALPVGPALRDVCLAAARAVGGGVLAIDVLETREGALTVGEVNHTMEFRNSVGPTGVNIPGRIIDFVLAHAGQAVNA